MGGICGPNLIPYLSRPTIQSPLNLQRVHGVRCCSVTPENDNKTKTPPLLRLAVSGVTELVRLFSYSSKDNNRVEKQLNSGNCVGISVSDVADVLRILKADYENAYFVTGNFTSAIYAEDCVFEDPTITFQGKELYSRNLKLLVPFFDSPSIGLQKIEKVASFDPVVKILSGLVLISYVKIMRMISAGDNNSLDRKDLHYYFGVNMETNFVLATWRLRTYLKLPWRPLISIDGSTFYELDEKLKTVRHAESWDVSALEAIGQIFTPGTSIGSPND